MAVPSYTSLLLKAKAFRMLIWIAMTLEGWFGPPRAKPAFTRKVTVKKPFKQGSFLLYFYVPQSYNKPENKGKKYPVVLNFHGGGFSIGDPREDERWALACTNNLDAVFVSVDYRLAPESVFPIALQDGISAIQYLEEYADELRLDVSNVVTSGFSAGGHLSISVPLLLAALQTESPAEPTSRSIVVPSDHKNLITFSGTNRLRIKGIAPFYAPADYSVSRADKRLTNREPRYNIPETFTSLFDYAFLPVHDQTPPDDSASGTGPLGRRDPFLSYGRASDAFLAQLAPQRVFAVTVEYDMIQVEMERFAERLGALGKDVKHHMVPKAQHGWDKRPSFENRDPLVVEARKLIGPVYDDVTAWIGETFKL